MVRQITHVEPRAAPAAAAGVVPVQQHVQHHSCIFKCTHSNRQQSDAEAQKVAQIEPEVPARLTCCCSLCSACESRTASTCSSGWQRSSSSCWRERSGGETLDRPAGTHSTQRSTWLVCRQSLHQTLDRPAVQAHIHTQDIAGCSLCAASTGIQLNQSFTHLVRNRSYISLGCPYAGNRTV